MKDDIFILLFIGRECGNLKKLIVRIFLKKYRIQKFSTSRTIKFQIVFNLHIICKMHLETIAVSFFEYQLLSVAMECGLFLIEFMVFYAKTWKFTITFCIRYPALYMLTRTWYIISLFMGADITFTTSVFDILWRSIRRFTNYPLLTNHPLYRYSRFFKQLYIQKLLRSSSRKNLW